MSNPGILAAAPSATTAPVPVDPRIELYYDVALISGTVLAVVLLLVLRAWQPRRAVGPLRVQPGRPLWPLLVVSLLGVSVWLGSQMAYGFWKVMQLAREYGPERQPQMSDFGPGDFAVLATVPGAAAFVCLLVGDRLAGRWAVAWLGFGRRALFRGVAMALLGVLIVLPIIQWVGIALEAVYKWLRYQHPQEHDLLRVIVQAPSPWAKWLLIAGAVGVAPFFEEYLFRGHLQTLLREAMLRRSRPRNEVPPDPAPAPLLPPPLPLEQAFPYGYPPPSGGGVPVGYADGAVFFPPVAAPPSSPPSDPRPPPDVPAVGPAVVAILVTSLCFAVVHPMWTWPLIFVLSCFLGYAYERTGNLWTCIAIHMAFNALSTIVYLNVFH